MNRTEFYLKSLQDLIARLSANSFIIKGWSITIASAFFALAATTRSPLISCLGVFPILMFWSLDGYYLTLERRYRKIFGGSFKALDKGELDFTFDHSIEKKDIQILYGIFSGPLILFYFSIIILLLLLTMAIPCLPQKLT